jgi:hypothetical protein
MNYEGIFSTSLYLQLFSLQVVKVFLHLKHYNKWPYGEAEVMFHIFMISALDGNNWLASLSHHLTTRP